jgi:molecular chaperone GrpE (heat shock protein)
VPEERIVDETVRQFLTGVAATERALLEALAKHGIRRIASLGAPFDPDRHEAVFDDHQWMRAQNVHDDRAAKPRHVRRSRPSPCCDWQSS